MQAHTWLVICLVVSCYGCATVDSPPQSLRVGSVPAEISDANLARALANYTIGLVHEGEGGGATEAAASHLRNAIAHDPGRHELYSLAVQIHLERQEPDKAIAILEHEVKARPDDVRSHLGLAVVLEALKRPDEAIAAYREAVRLKPDAVRLYLALAKVYLDQDADALAISVFREGVQKTDRDDVIVGYCFGEAMSHVSDGHFARAIPFLEMVRECDPVRRRDADRLMAELHNALGCPERAMVHLKRAVLEDPPEVDDIRRLASALVRMDRLRDAVTTLERGRKRLPESDELAVALAYVQILRKSYGEAIGILEAVAARVADRNADPLSEEFYLLLGEALDQSGRKEASEAVFEDGIRQHPKASMLLNYLAYTWAERGEKLGRARAYVERALAEQPDNGAYVDTLGWVCFRQARFEDALKLLQRASKLMEGDPTILEHVGDAFLALNRKEDAVASWVRSFLVDSENKRVEEKLLQHGYNPATLKQQADELNRKAADKE